MSESQPRSGFDDSEIYSDTCVLIDYTLDRDDGSSATLLTEDRCEIVCGPTVSQEYTDVVERMEILVDSLIMAEEDGEISDDWDIPDSIDLNDNDQRYLISLMTDLASLDGKETRRRLQDEESRLKNGQWKIFEKTDPFVEVLNCNRDPQVRGNLNSIISNQKDVNVLTEAIDWSTNGGTGTTMSADWDDIISNREQISERIRAISGHSSIIILTPEEIVSS